MKVYNTDAVRNVALISHQGAGKTALTEALLLNAGIINRMGENSQGNTVSDHDEEEIRRGLSLSTSLIPIETANLKFNFLDTPGYTDFQGEVRHAVFVSDLALILVDASSGVEVGTELYWSYCDEFDVPRMVVISKNDRDMARAPEPLLEELSTIFGARFVPLQLPIGSGVEFAGVVDVLTQTAMMGADGAKGAIPDEMQDAAEAAFTELTEAAAESDDDLLEKYFDAGELTEDEIRQGLKEGIRKGTFVPVVFTSGTANVGVKPMMDLLVDVAPTPVAHQFPQASTDDMITAESSNGSVFYVFKTTADPFVGRLTYFRVVTGTANADTRYSNHNKGEEERFGPLYAMRGKEQLTVETLNAGDIGAVAKLNHTVTGDTLGDKGSGITIQMPDFPSPVYAVAVTPATQADSAKMGPLLTRLTEEDPTLQWRQDAATKEAVLEGMGDVHVDVAVRRAAQLGAGLETAIPRIPYRETITRTNSDQYRHKKQTGGAGQFAEVHLRVEPLERGQGFEYASEVFGGSISHSFIPSIEKGIRGVLENGVMAGYPVVDVKAIVYDGKEHPVDSKDIAFQIAGREVFKLAFMGAGPALLEPIVKLRITVPETSMGDTIGDLSSRRAQVQQTDSVSGRAVITALAPLAEVQRYSNDLRSLTQGRGVYTLEFSHYQPAPAHVAQDVVNAAKRREEEEN